MQKVKLIVIAVDTVLILILMIIVITFLLAQCHMEEDSEDHLEDHSEDHSVALVDHSVVLEELAVVSEDHLVGKASATHTCAESIISFFINYYIL